MTTPALALSGRPRYFAAPVTWRVGHVDQVVDGDTVDLELVRTLETLLTDLDECTRLVERRELEAAHRCRLVWVDAPERADRTAWAAARGALNLWLGAACALGPIVAVAHAVDAFGRLLVDLRDAAGQSASEWLLRPVADGGAGLDPYTGAAR